MERILREYHELGIVDSGSSFVICDLTSISLVYYILGIYGICYVFAATEKQWEEEARSIDRLEISAECNRRALSWRSNENCSVRVASLVSR